MKWKLGLLGVGLIVLPIGLVACDPQDGQMEKEVTARNAMMKEEIYERDMNNEEQLKWSAKLRADKLADAENDAKIEVIKAKAAAEENRLIEESLKDKEELLKKWVPAAGDGRFEESSTPATPGYAECEGGDANNGVVCYTCHNSMCTIH